MEVLNILALLGLDSNKFIVEPAIYQCKNEITIHAEQVDDSPRVCPHCGSHNVVIKDKEFVSINLSSYCIAFSQKVILFLKKRKYKCKKCSKTYTQRTPLVSKNQGISSAIKFYIYEATKEIISFKKIAKDLKVSEFTVRNIFAHLPTEGRKPLSTAICIDEKRFVTDQGKYACIISNAITGDLIDVIPSRTSDYLNDFFKNISQNERQKVRFFVSDMFEGYRTIKKKWFPNAIDIIDYFHVTKLFTDALQVLRKQLMNHFSRDSKEYKFLKNNWKIFLINPYSDSSKLVNEKIIYCTELGEYKNLKTVIKEYLHIFPEFLELYNLYSDFNQYIKKGTDRTTVENNLEFIINKACVSTNYLTNKIGYTLLNFYNEIVDTYSSTNVNFLNNGIAEGNNSKIQKLISVCNGIRTFATFRKRLLHLKKGG